MSSAELFGLLVVIGTLGMVFYGRRWLASSRVQARVEQSAITPGAEIHDRKLIEASLDQLLTIDTEGKITDVNRATETITGLARDKLIGSEFSQYVVETGLARAGYQQAFRDETVRDLLLGVKHADGKTVTQVLYNAAVYRDHTGAVAGVFAAARDISQLKAAEKVQARVSRALRLVTDGNHLLVHADDEQALLNDLCRLLVERGGYHMAWVGFAEHDAEKSVIPVAKAGSDNGYLSSVRISWGDTRFGRGPTGRAIRLGETVVNQDYLSDPAMAPWRESALRRGYQSSMAVPLVRDGRTLGALTLYSIEPYAFVPEEVALLEELAGNFAYGIEMLRVRRLQAVAEDSLGAYRRELEVLVARRTSELATAKAEADRANNAKSRFLAAASHDLRQPLAALSLYVGVLRRVVTKDHTLVKNIQGCVDSLSELLTDLLDISKLDAGVVKPDFGDFAIADALAKLLAQNSSEAQLKGIELRLRDSALIARSDRVLFKRILGNLIANAVRYTERGGVLVGCRRHQGRMWVEIWDTGIGIPADMTTAIFEEYRQLGDDARVRGSGLGLAIVDKTATVLGLQIRVRSRLGKGSLFAVELPLGQALPAGTSDTVGASPGPSRPIRIALVDDNSLVLDALVCSLENFGHHVVAGASWSEVVGRLGADVPDLVISDYRLAEGETGVDVIAAARTAFGGGLPAIIVTGDTSPAIISSMAQRGLSVMHKPIGIDALNLRIAEIVGRVNVDAPIAADRAHATSVSANASKAG